MNTPQKHTPTLPAKAPEPHQSYRMNNSTLAALLVTLTSTTDKLSHIQDTDLKQCQEGWNPVLPDAWMWRRHEKVDRCVSNASKNEDPTKTDKADDFHKTEQLIWEWKHLANSAQLIHDVYLGRSIQR